MMLGYHSREATHFHPRSRFRCGGRAIAMPVLFQNSVERSCRFSVVTAEDPAESFASRDQA